MKLEQLAQVRGTLQLDNLLESDGVSVLKLGIGTLYVHWIFLHGKYRIDFISGDPEGNDRLARDNELEEWVLSQLAEQNPAIAA